MCITNVVDIEESVWAPRYGLKGMVDASVEVGFDASPAQARSSSFFL